MSWNINTSRARVEEYIQNMGDIYIEPLDREANLDSLLTPTNCRDIYGAHVYAQVSNFACLASSLTDEDEYKRMIQALHIYQREVARIVESNAIFDGFRVHFQGSKLHALFYRPIRNPRAIATRAVLLQLVLKDFVTNVFNPAFSIDDFKIAGGTDIGNAIGTSNGIKGDRELLFIGSPANYAAKIVSDDWKMRLTERVYAELPADLQNLCFECGEGIYQLIGLHLIALNDLLDKYGIGWSREDSASRIESDKASSPLSIIKFSSADTLIRLDDLSIHNSKRVEAASVFADVSGFTRYIDHAERDGRVTDALKVFHVIRRELATVIKVDFDGIRIQYQGDRVQGLLHLPKDDQSSIALKAVRMAAAMQSSMGIIKQSLWGIQELTLAVGVDFGTTLVSKLGQHAYRDRICLGEPVEMAARNEEKCEGNQIGIGSAVYDALPKQVQAPFTYSRSVQCYVATDLDAYKLGLIEDAIAYDHQKGVYVQPGAILKINSEEVPNAQPFRPARPYAP